MTVITVIITTQLQQEVVDTHTTTTGIGSNLGVLADPHPFFFKFKSIYINTS